MNKTKIPLLLSLMSCALGNTALFAVAHYRITDPAVSNSTLLQQWDAPGTAAFDLSTITAPELNLVFIIEARKTASGEVYAKSYRQGTYTNLKLELAADSDGDGMPDYWETAYGLNITVDDSGADLETPPDGLTNLEEYHFMTNPTVADTDGDFIDDGYEIDHLQDPNNSQESHADFDNDGLSAWLEYQGSMMGLAMSDLPEFEAPVDMGAYSGDQIIPKEINNQGEVVGAYGFIGTTWPNVGVFYSIPYHWSEASRTMLTLDLAQDMEKGLAIDINDSGLIVGEAEVPYQVWDDDDGEWYTYQTLKTVFWNTASSSHTVLQPPASVFPYNDTNNPFFPIKLLPNDHIFLKFNNSNNVGQSGLGRLKLLEGSSYTDLGELRASSGYQPQHYVLNDTGDLFHSTPTNTAYGNVPELKIRLDGESSSTVYTISNYLTGASHTLYGANNQRKATGQADGKPYFFEAGYFDYLVVEGPTGYGQGLSINEKNWIVGDSEAIDQLLVATLWTPHSPALDLNALIPAGSDWDLVSATAINEHGDIVGYGYREGVAQYRAFYLKAISQDDDGDGLSNDWEDFWSYTLNGSVGDILGHGDADGDNVNNYTEYLLGTYLNESDDEADLPDSQASPYDADLIIVLDDQVFEAKQRSDSISLRSHHIR